MYRAERGLFELRQGRPILVSEGEDGEAPVLAAAVEGLRPETLEVLRELTGGAPVRLIVTGHRGRSMRILTRERMVEGAEGGAVSIPLSGGEGVDRIFQLAAAPGVPGAPVAGSRPATPGETAALDLLRVGRLLPALLGVSLPGELPEALRAALDSGQILRLPRPDLTAAFADTSVELLHVSEAPVPLELTEDSRFALFRERGGLVEHVAIMIGDPAQWPEAVPVRLHSACLTGDIFGSLRCDCGEQLRGSLRYFVEQEGGILLYLAQEGRGIGLGNKLRAYLLQESGLDTIDADCSLGFGADERTYEAAVGMLRQLGVNKVQLLTNNPDKLRALQEAGIEVVDRRGLHGRLNRHNEAYVRAKVDRAGHWLQGMLGG
jgi:GTP cyclohydrolase II